MIVVVVVSRLSSLLSFALVVIIAGLNMHLVDVDESFTVVIFIG